MDFELDFFFNLKQPKIVISKMFVYCNVINDVRAYMTFTSGVIFAKTINIL